MANRNIAFTITINGVETTVNTIGELEAALRRARTELKNFTGDEGARQRLINDIRNADKVVKDFNQSIKGNAIDVQIGKFIQFGSAITSVFAAAQSALSLFGRDSEAAAEAQVQAQQLLTIAITAGEIARQKETFQTIINTTAKIANIAATQGLVAATRALFTILKANPFGAVLTLITAIVGALITFTDETNSAADAEEKYKKKLEETNREREIQLLILEKNGATELELAQRRKSDFETDLQNARALVRIYIQQGASQKQLNQEFLRINTAKEGILREGIRITRLQQQDEEKLEQNRAKNAEAERQRRLERLRLLGEERKRTLDLITQGIELELPQGQLELEKQNEVLKSLSVSQSDYNTVLQQYNDLLVAINPQEIVKSFRGNEAFQNQLSLTKDLVKATIELSGLPIQTTQKGLMDLLESQRSFVQGTNKNYDEYVKTQQDLLNFEQNFINSFVKTNIAGFKGSTDEVAEQRKLLTEQAKVVFDNLIENAKKLDGLNATYETTIKKIQTLTDENEKLGKSTEVLNGFLQKNQELLVKSFEIPITFGQSAKASILTLENEIATKRFDQAKQFATDVEVLEYNLLQNGIDVRNASYEQKLQLLLAFIKKEVEATEQGEKDKQDSFQKTVDKIQNAVQNFQTGLQAIQQTVSDYYNFQFDLLEKRNKRALENIKDDSERGAQLRVEQEKIYLAEKTRLEKQQAKNSLRIALAQTIANTAEAVSRNLSFPPLAILVGIAGAAQAAIITGQINQIDSYKRGGRVRLSQGGMVSGPSHEMGGVKFQGGGIELEGNEAVINRLSTLQYADILSTINQAGGGRPIVMNGFDDSRIVEAIAKQRQTPIRAYVVESDITNAQTINKRLELLSQI